MLFFVYYENGNLRYGNDLAKIRAAAGKETEAEVHVIDSPLPVPVVVPEPAAQVQP